MITVTAAASKPMHLVDDEVIILDYKGEDEAVRLRIWRHVGETPVVLVSREPGFISPRRVSTRMANLALRSYLAYHHRGMIFLEWDGKRLWVVDFIGWGHNDRLFLVRPEYQELGLTDFYALVGNHVEM